MTSLFADLAERERGRLKEGKQPQRITPMKAVLTDDYFSDPNWIYEPKLDGEQLVRTAPAARAQVPSLCGPALGQKDALGEARARGPDRVLRMDR